MVLYYIYTRWYNSKHYELVWMRNANIQKVSYTHKCIPCLKQQLTCSQDFVIYKWIFHLSKLRQNVVVRYRVNIVRQILRRKHGICIKEFLLCTLIIVEGKWIQRFSVYTYWMSKVEIPATLSRKKEDILSRYIEWLLMKNIPFFILI